MFDSIDVTRYMEYMEEITDIKTSQIDAGYPWGTISKEEAENSYNRLIEEINVDSDLPDAQKRELKTTIESIKAILGARQEEIERAIEKNADIPESVYNKYFEDYEDFLEKRREQELKHGVQFNTEEKKWEELVIKLFSGVERRSFKDNPSKHDVFVSYYIFFTPEEINGIIDGNAEVLKKAFERIKKEYPNVAPDLADDVDGITNKTKEQKEI